MRRLLRESYGNAQVAHPKLTHKLTHSIPDSAPSSETEPRCLKNLCRDVIHVGLGQTGINGLPKEKRPA